VVRLNTRSASWAKSDGSPAGSGDSLCSSARGVRENTPAVYGASENGGYLSVTSTNA
jgi:hypothetical protein